MTKSRFLSLDRPTALQLVGERTLNNVNVTHKLLTYCIENGWNLRISSDVIPLATLPDAKFSINDLPHKDLIRHSFTECVKIIKSGKIRCSTHPDQYVVPASLNPDVVKKSIIELNYHGYIMDMFGLPQSYQSPINIHMNSFKGSTLKDTTKRFVDAFNLLNDNVKSRLVLENEDKPNSWNVKQLYDHIHQELGIPITYDNLHHRCNPGDLSSVEAFNLAKSTWKNHVPLFHFSDTDASLKNPRAHADYVQSIPVEYDNDERIDLEFEFKSKDLAIKDFELRYEKVSP